jgi:hypothetical protein
MNNLDDLINNLAQEAAAVKPAPHPFMLSARWTAWAAGFLILSLALSGLRPDIMQELQRPWFVIELAALLCILVATSMSAALLSFPDLHQMRRLVLMPVIAFALLVLVLIFAWMADNPAAPLPIHSFECTISIMLVSMLPAAWTLYSMRKFASTHTGWAGSIALLFAFSVGALWLRLHEVNDSIAHLIEWHYLPMIGFGTLGLWLGKKVLKW